MTKSDDDKNFWSSLCADLAAEGGQLIRMPPVVTVDTEGPDFLLRLDVPGFHEDDLTVSHDATSVLIEGRASPTDPLPRAVRPESQSAEPTPPWAIGGIANPRDFLVRRPVPPRYDLDRLVAVLNGTVLTVTIPAKPGPEPIHPDMPERPVRKVTVRRQDS